ncbi:uncharacterized protein FOMMEDRAFT_93219, partial [Fomitiporia mediterranea MF3/22]|uniref:uncharacterized protein n=1 Tax=Fomitiporia mediterranea (strain MF3/22) TaxID=694068 RepID=UPI000440768D
VAMHIATSIRYELNTTEGAEEWKRLVPSQGHVVFVNADSRSWPKPYTVTLFHQMKCLDILREAYLSPPVERPSMLVRHCLNYLRQTVLCRPNLWLESVKNPAGQASREYDMVCHDWTKVYEEAERNQMEFKAWKENNVSNVTNYSSDS